MDPKSHQSTISQIHSELTKVRSELAPGVDLYLTNAAPPHHNTHAHRGHGHGHTQNKNAHQGQHPGHEKERTRLSELLLQSLLRLDGITATSSNESRDDVRRERKEAVKEVQGLLDRLDARGGDASQS